MAPLAQGPMMAETWGATREAKASRREIPA